MPDLTLSAQTLAVWPDGGRVPERLVLGPVAVEAIAL